MGKSDVLKIFIGWDSREVVAYNVLSYSIIKNASCTVAITPLKLGVIDGFHRPYANQTTEFTYSRFMVPYLCDYSGMAVFMDCDMLCLSDISELINCHQAANAVSVVKHDYVPKDTIKSMGKQVPYKKKNWSSLMVFDCEQCRALTPEYVNSANGLRLHQFKWVQNVGPLPSAWNHLVGEYKYRADAKLVHFTNGGPWYEGWANVDYSPLWRQYKQEMLSAELPDLDIND